MNKRLVFGAILFFTVVLVIGCSGGGSSGGGPVYTGKTTPALITEENGKEIVVNSMESKESKQLGSVFGAAEVEDTSISYHYNVATNIASVVEKLNLSPDYYSAASETLTGNCGGTATVNSSSDTGATVTFSNFCDTASFDTSGATFTGAMSVSFSDAGLSMTISNFSVKGTIDGVLVDVLMSGTMVMSFDTDISITMSLITQDNISKQTSKIENFTLAVNSAGDTTIEGRIYFAKYGYVDLETVIPLEFSFTSGFSNGTLKASGSNGSNASISFSGNTYTLTIDIDGDGVADSTETGENASLDLAAFD